MTAQERDVRSPWRRPRRANGRRFAHRGAGWRLGFHACCDKPARAAHADDCARRLHDATEEVPA